MRKTNTANFLTAFFNSEIASGILLICCTALSIIITNTQFGGPYLDFWHIGIGPDFGDVALHHSLEHWINEGLMAVFFLVVGLEIKKELLIGELSDLKKASLPFFAAFGGMITPAAIHFLVNHGTASQSGAGIPIATDIAFALGVLALLGSRIPPALKAFLAALAVIDDLGAIVVIALFYASSLSVANLVPALGIFCGLLALNRLGVRPLPFYIIPGLFMWYFMSRSGIHATITGVLLAFAIPFSGNTERSPSFILHRFLHKPVMFFIVPLFAIANTGIILTVSLSGIVSGNSLGIIAGLLCGKPLGITLFSMLAVKAGLSRLPGRVTWKHIIGAGFLGGIGFTMSIFITTLSFDNPQIIQSSKISILLGSLLSGIVGFNFLGWLARSRGAGKSITGVPREQ